VAQSGRLPGTRGVQLNPERATPLPGWRSVVAAQFGAAGLNPSERALQKNEVKHLKNLSRVQNRATPRKSPQAPGFHVKPPPALPSTLPTIHPPRKPAALLMPRSVC
jgi:hypothetical protein